MAAKGKNIEQIKEDHLLASTGFIFPRTEAELASFNKLYPDEDFELKGYQLDPEKILKKAESKLNCTPFNFNYKNNQNTYFKRAVLAAEIVYQLYNEPTFGHVKFQKLMFLCENIRGININYQYSKQAAGPYDNKLMHSIDHELKKQKWFLVEKPKNSPLSRYSFLPMEKCGGHKSYFSKYFGQQQDKIQWFIDTFKKQKTYKVELIATLYACWMELNEKNKIPSDKTLLSLLYDWSKQKSKYPEYAVLNAIQWMKDNNVVPY